MLFVTGVGTLVNVVLMCAAFSENRGFAAIVHLFLAVVFGAAFLLLEERAAMRVSAMERHPAGKGL